MIYIVGFVVGIVSGLFSSGGGLIIVPFLVEILKIDEYIARGTALVCVLGMVLAGMFFYYKNNYLNLEIAMYATIGGIIRWVYWG